MGSVDTTVAEQIRERPLLLDALEEYTKAASIRGSILRIPLVRVTS